jgi:hypothetical protein
MPHSKKKEGLLMTTEKTSLTFDDYVRGIQSLRPEEQLSLVEIISARLKKFIKHKKTKHNVMELEGLGAHIWKDIEAQQYVSTERKSWD